MICNETTKHHAPVKSARKARRDRRMAAESTYCAALVESALIALFAAVSE
jgi:hypothetical protein